MDNNRFKDRLVSAEGWAGKMKPVYVGGMFFSNNPDTMEGWGVGIPKWAHKDNWALWVDGHGFVCGSDNMCWPVSPHPFTMPRETAKRLCKIGIDNWGQIFFVENKDYYAQLIEKAVKRMGHIQLDNPVEVVYQFFKKPHYIVDSIDEGLKICAFQVNGKWYSLNCCETLSVVAVGRELVRTLANMNVKL